MLGRSKISIWVGARFQVKTKKDIKLGLSKKSIWDGGRNQGVIEQDIK